MRRLIETVDAVMNRHQLPDSLARRIDDDFFAPTEPEYPLANVLEPKPNRSIQPRDGNALVGVVYGLAIQVIIGAVVLGVLVLMGRL